MTTPPAAFDGSGAYLQAAIEHLPVVAELTEQELGRQVGREPAVAFEGRMLGGVRVPDRALEDHDADDGQVTAPEPDDEPTERPARLEFWKEKAKWAETARDYLDAEARVDALLAGTIPDKTAAEPPVVEPKPKAPTKMVRIKRIVARDPTTENISEIHEWDIECPLDPVTGEPIVRAHPTP
jgi:hypothetical protein